MAEAWQVTTTTGDRALAERIAAELVDRRLAACVQIVGPITSLYHWQGKIEQAEEWLCIAKTTSSRFRALEEVISALHPYVTPEIIATPIVGASDPYLNWLKHELSPTAHHEPQADLPAPPLDEEPT